MSDLEDELEHKAATFDQARLRQVMGHFATGVTIITAMERDEPVGLTAQSFTSLSLDPPLILFSPGKTSSTWPRIEKAGYFTVNILGQAQEAVCRTFAVSGGDKFAEVEWTPSEITGSPLLDDVLAWVDCSVVTTHDAGDHIIVVGRVLDLGVEQEGKPLLFYRGGFGTFDS
ncbi:MAG: 3-hydroxy-9,10-secoandrosta,3,5(10)-triene-9,17-dione monooxygenase reductase component [Actinomycetota bacterium]|jgi:flavin reductase (DIM6/NTAB) family NADH-FMN oxidoreductase RutF